MMWRKVSRDAPAFIWDEGELLRAEWLFLSEAGLASGAAKHLSVQLHSELALSCLTDDALSTLELEGEIVGSEDMERSLRCHLGLGASKERPVEEVEIVAEILTRVVQRYAAPFSCDALISAGRRLEAIWDASLNRHRAQAAAPEAAPSSPADNNAKPSHHARQEIESLSRWFSDSGTDTQAGSALVRAGLTHLWFESIHPFRHGNGILGRCLAEKMLLAHEPGVNFIPLSPVFLSRRNEYFRNLDDACRDRDATGWLLWFAAASVEALRRYRARISFLIERDRMLDTLRDVVCQRQEALLRHLFSLGPGAATRGISASRYARVSGLSPTAAATDLANLAGCSALVRKIHGRTFRYYLNHSVPPVGPVYPEDIR